MTTGLPLLMIPVEISTPILLDELGGERLRGG